jgi:hypothetical protein
VPAKHAPAAIPAFEVGDRVILRKPHPCGATGWIVTRTGADIGLCCGGCGRRVLLERRDLEARLVTIERGGAAT